jgi:hypothetical protein
MRREARVDGHPDAGHCTKARDAYAGGESDDPKGGLSDTLVCARALATIRRIVTRRSMPPGIGNFISIGR